MISASFFSGGKESIYALFKALKMGLDVKYLIYCNYDFPRVSPHALNIEVVRVEAKLIGLPLIECSPRKGVEVEFLRGLLVKLGVEAVVGGDIYLIDHYNWLEKLCSPIGIKCVEPLWVGGEEKSKNILIEEVNDGIEAIICGVRDKLNGKLLGKTINKEFLNEFLEYCSSVNIDPCGEKGEYHTIVLRSPIYRKSIQVLNHSIIRENDYIYIKVNDYKIV
ncbi:MAG: diphthine--ammonia ligase [Candidatus Methanomethylicia archaeon]